MTLWIATLTRRESPYRTFMAPVGGETRAEAKALADKDPLVATGRYKVTDLQLIGAVRDIQGNVYNVELRKAD